MKRSILAVTVLCALTPGMALAKSSYLRTFKQTYPEAKKIQNCTLCHETGGYKLNYYGQDLEKANLDFKAVEHLDSDGDSFKNLDEIIAETYPGDKVSLPSVAK